MTDDDDTEISITSEMGTFGIVPIWVLPFKDHKGKGLSGSELRVYISLRSFADRVSREAYPHVKTIAARADVHLTTAHKAIARLRDMGLIATKRRYRADGSISRCDYKLFDIEPKRHDNPEGVLAISPVPPSEETRGSLPRGQSKNRSLKPTTRTHTSDKSCLPASGGAGATDFNPDWRDEDRELFRRLLGENIRADGKPWTKGEHSADAFYGAFRRARKQRWPGRYMQKIDDDQGLDDWLAEQGLERVG